MNTNRSVAAPPPEATPVQAGTFSLGAAILRVLPTLGWLPFNYTPVGGLAVFSGARVRAWLAYVFPVAVMVATDCVLWAIKDASYSPLHASRPIVYGSFLIYVLLGRWLGRHGLLGLGGAAILGSVQFFLLTNLFDWLKPDSIYARTLDGLVQCYVAGIPYYHGTFFGDLCFPFVFVGFHALWLRLAQQPTEQVGVSQ